MNEDNDEGRAYQNKHEFHRESKALKFIIHERQESLDTRIEWMVRRLAEKFDDEIDDEKKRFDIQ